MSNREKIFDYPAVRAVYLATRTDEQLQRLIDVLTRRIYAACEGSASFGVDLPTLRIVNPGYYDAYCELRAEYRRRKSNPVT